MDLDFLTPDPLPEPQPERTPEPEPQPAASVAQVIEASEAIEKAQAAAEIAKRKAAARAVGLPELFDADGRHLGPRGYIAVISGQLKAARAAGNQAEVEKLQAQLALCEQSLREWCTVNGQPIQPPHAALMQRSAPDPDRALARIEQLRRQHDEADAAGRVSHLYQQKDVLKWQIERAWPAGRGVLQAELRGIDLQLNGARVRTALMHMQRLRADSAIAALNAGLLKREDLDSASKRGAWSVLAERGVYSTTAVRIYGSSQAEESEEQQQQNEERDRHAR